ncbi:hypothetical protein ACCS45_03955 [Rhizobium ruizarguesonis]
MPGALTGLDLAAMVSSVAPRTAIIVASGRDVSEGLSPEWSFMPKPYSLDRALALLKDRLVAPIVRPGFAEAV